MNFGNRQDPYLLPPLLLGLAKVGLSDFLCRDFNVAICCNVVASKFVTPILNGLNGVLQDPVSRSTVHILRDGFTYWDVGSANGQ